MARAATFPMDLGYTRLTTGGKPVMITENGIRQPCPQSTDLLLDQQGFGAFRWQTANFLTEMI